MTVVPMMRQPPLLSLQQSLQELQDAGTLHNLYRTLGYGYILAWGLSFYPQLYMNWQRKSTSGLSMGYLWYNLLGFFLYLIYSTYAPGCTMQDQVFALHAFVLTTLTLMQVPKYNTNKLSDFPQLHGKIAGSMLIVLDFCLLLNVVQFFSFMDLVYVCGFLKVVISIIKYTPQFYLNYQQKSTTGFAMGMVYCDLAGGLLFLLQILVTCSYDPSTASARPVWTWEPFSGNKAKVFLGLLMIAFDLAFISQHNMYAMRVPPKTPTEQPFQSKPVFQGRAPAFRQARRSPLGDQASSSDSDQCSTGGSNGGAAAGVKTA